MKSAAEQSIMLNLYYVSLMYVMTLIETSEQLCKTYFNLVVIELDRFFFTNFICMPPDYFVKERMNIQNHLASTASSHHLLQVLPLWRHKRLPSSP